MDSRTDQELLREYAAEGSDSAFSEIVRRYVDFVYSAALRLAGNSHLAEDISQRVFLALARHAHQLTDRALLAGWLHLTARNVTANAIRTEVRRRVWEKEAAAMNQLLTPDQEPAWESIAPHLDDAIGQLSEPDRDAILLRYFQHKSAQEMAQSLGISSEAAQKRVNRAIERLRGLFADRGIAAGAGGLTLLLSANAVQAAPASLTLAISATALAAASTSVSTSATISTAKIILMTTLQKALIASAVVAVVGGGIYQTRKHARAAQQLQASRKQSPTSSSAPLLHSSNTAAALAAARASQRPANVRKSATPSASQSAKPGGFQSTEMYALLGSKKARLTAAQAAPYLAANGRNASSLLAAFRTTGDLALLNEALQKYSTDPHVGLEAAIRNDASPQQRRAALDAFKMAAPENALASYLSALDHFKAGQVDDAVNDLNVAATKQQFQDYTLDRIRTDEDMYRQAGYPPGESQFIANAFLPEAHLVQLAELGRNLVDLSAGYGSIGDPESQQAALQMALNLGRQLDDPAASQTMRWQLIGIRVERDALEVMDPNSQVSGTTQLVQDRLNELARQKDSIQQLTKQADPLWKTLSDQDWTTYHSQIASSGEEAAVRWLVSNYPKR